MKLRKRSGGRQALGDVSNKRGLDGNLPKEKGVKRQKTSQSSNNDEATNLLPPAPPSNANSNSNSTSNYSGANSNSLPVPPPTSTINSSKKKTKTEGESESISKSGSSSASSAVTKKFTSSNSSASASASSSSASVSPPALVPPQFRMQQANFDNKTYTSGVMDVDKEDLNDVLHVADYVSDLFQHLHSAEENQCPGMYMHNQTDINAKMRAILVDWLVEVHMKFNLVPETLFLCINVIDRYCEIVNVPRAKLQLVGVTALLIACKYEEIYPPEVRDCVYITDNAYTRQDVLDMEHDMLKKLKFEITVPTAFPFLTRFLRITKASTLARHAASYYAERTLQEHDMLNYAPSLVGCSAVYLALNNPDIVGRSQVAGWHPLLAEYAGYSKEEVEKCAAKISKKVSEEPVTASKRQLIAVKKKYSHEKYQFVSESYTNPSLSLSSNE